MLPLRMFHVEHSAHLEAANSLLTTHIDHSIRRQEGVGPPIGVIRWGFADNQSPPSAKQRRCPADSHGRGGKTAGRGYVKELRLSLSQGTDVFVEHRHPTYELQSSHGSPQQVRPGTAALDQHNLKIRAAAGDHETRQTTSRT